MPLKAKMIVRVSGCSMMFDERGAIKRHIDAAESYLQDKTGWIPRMIEIKHLLRTGDTRKYQVCWTNWT